MEIDKSIVDSAFAKIKNLMPALGQKHSYYNHKCGLEAAEIFASWAKEHYKPMVISCNQYRIKPDTLKIRIQEGLKWNCDNTDGPAQEHYDQLRRLTQYKIVHNSLQMFRNTSVISTIEYLPDTSILDLRTDFLAWIASDPNINATWPAGKMTRLLGPDEVEWFATKQKELDDKNAGYVSVIKVDGIRFRRIPV